MRDGEKRGPEMLTKGSSSPFNWRRSSSIESRLRLGGHRRVVEEDVGGATVDGADVDDPSTERGVAATQPTFRRQCLSPCRPARGGTRRRKKEVAALGE